VIHRGSVYFVNLAPTQGHEQSGRRPVLVVSSDAINRQPLVVTVVVGTSARNIPRDYPVNVRVPAEESGLPEDTVFLCFQLRSLDPGRLEGPTGGEIQEAGRLPPPRMREVESALRLALSL
jgi:mRNA interferase MazF